MNVLFFRSFLCEARIHDGFLPTFFPFAHAVCVSSIWEVCTIGLLSPALLRLPSLCLLCSCLDGIDLIFTHQFFCSRKLHGLFFLKKGRRAAWGRFLLYVYVNVMRDENSVKGEMLIVVVFFYLAVDQSFLDILCMIMICVFSG